MDPEETAAYLEARARWADKWGTGRPDGYIVVCAGKPSGWRLCWQCKGSGSYLRPDYGSDSNWVSCDECS